MDDELVRYLKDFFFYNFTDNEYFRYSKINFLSVE